jgi:ABC-type taurine transport system ATPase subunit
MNAPIACLNASFKQKHIFLSKRCGIPVIIMGETGCGKTRLIRFMCELQAGPDGPKNLLLMKVWLVLPTFLSTLVFAKFTRRTFHCNLNFNFRRIVLGTNR